MQNFHDFYFGLSNAERVAYVKRVGTSIGYAERVAGGFALPSLVMALRLVRKAKGAIDIESIVKTYEAKNGRVV